MRAMPGSSSRSSAAPPSALAFAVESPAPPAALRSRILEAARAERPNVVPLRPRWAAGRLRRRRGRRRARRSASGSGRSSLSRSLDRERSARAGGSSRSSPTRRARGSARERPRPGTLARRPRTAKATLIVSKLERAPDGQHLRGVGDQGQQAACAPGRSRAAATRSVVPLDRRVSRRARSSP